MRILLGVLLSLGVIAFSVDWFLLSYQGIEPQVWQISVGLIIISLVMLKSSIEEIYLWSKARTEKKNQQKALMDLHDRMSSETAKLYANVKLETTFEAEKALENNDVKEQKNTTTLGDVLKSESSEEVKVVEYVVEEVVEQEEKIVRAQ